MRKFQKSLRKEVVRPRSGSAALNFGLGTITFGGSNGYVVLATTPRFYGQYWVDLGTRPVVLAAWSGSYAERLIEPYPRHAFLD